MRARCRRFLFSSSTDGNCRQEAGSVRLKPATNMAGMEAGIASIVIRWRVKLFGGLLAFWLLASQWTAGRAHAAVVESPQRTLIVFSDQRLSDSQWKALSESVQSEVARAAFETHVLPPAIEVIQGSRVEPGFRADEPVSVYLHGGCTVIPRSQKYVVEGALGWVLRDHGHIGPFIHVDCGRISEMIGQHALGMSRERRDEVMAEAISRVLVHELIHIATQNAGHTADGIEKSSFSVLDLMPDVHSRGMHAGEGK